MLPVSVLVPLQGYFATVIFSYSAILNGDVINFGST